MSDRPPNVSAAAGDLVRRVWRAPTTDRAAVIAPPWATAPQIARSQASQLSALSGEIQGQSWATLRTASRVACLTAANDYHAELGFPAKTESQTGPLIVDGHQPELFHPGVWAKNFAVHALTQKTQGVGLHLIVDNDTCQRTAIRVPGGDRHQPRTEWLPFDAAHPPQPWEEVRVSDPALFASFGDRIFSALQSWSVLPLVTTVWPAAVQALQQGRNLVDCLTVARMTAERAWSAGNLELPLSRLCTTPPFLWFAAAVLVRATEFARHHNAVLAEYRRLNRIRSRAHPVPELATTADGWTEAPFWIWRAGETRRDRLFVRQHGDELWLRNRDDVFLRLSLTAEQSAENAVEPLQTLAGRGWRLRTRALTTTLFARLCLADLFIHGLGGAKYDEMTDALMTRFFGVTPPEFLTVTATRHLPLGPSEPVTAEELGRLRHTAWDLVHNPQRYLAHAESAADLIAERQELVRLLLGESNRKHRALRRQAYLRVHEINDTLAAQLRERRDQLAADIARLEHRRAANRILRSREFSWVLFPADSLPDFYHTLFA